MCTFRGMLAAAMTAVLAVGQGTATTAGATCGAEAACEGGLCWCGADCGKCGEKAVVYRGCYKNADDDRVEGHHRDKTVSECQQIATNAMQSYFGMEHPQDFPVAGKAQCLTMNAMPSMTKVADTECSVEVHAGDLLGGTSRLAVYMWGASRDAPLGSFQECLGKTKRCVTYGKTDWISEENSMAQVSLKGKVNSVGKCKDSCDRRADCDRISGMGCKWKDNCHDQCNKDATIDDPIPGLAATGMSCKGRFCDNVALSLMSITVAAVPEWARSKTEGQRRDSAHKDWTNIFQSGWISDNKGKKYAWNKKTDGLTADCPEDMFVTRIECRGRYCDDLRILCGPSSTDNDHTPEGAPKARPVWLVVGEKWESDWFSEEGSGSQECPVGFVLTGVECQENKQESGACIAKCGHYCDNKRIRCRQIRPNAEAASTGIASAMQMVNAQAPSVHCNATCVAALYPEEDKTTPDKAITGAISGAVSPSSFCAFALAALSLWL